MSCAVPSSASTAERSSWTWAASRTKEPGHCRHVQARAGEVDAAAGPECAGVAAFTEDAVVLLGADLHQEGAVVDDQGLSFRDVVHHARIVDGGGQRDGGLGVGLAELDEVADFQVVGLVEVSGADRRAGEVEKHGGVKLALGGLAAHEPGHLARPLVLRVAHVEPEDVGAGVEELADGFLLLGGGTEGDDELGFAGHGEGQGEVV